MSPSSSIRRPLALLRFALWADVATSAPFALVLLFGATPLAAALALPEPLLRGAGLLLLPFVAALAWLARHPAPPRVALLAAIGLNALWVVESVALPLLGWVQPNALGQALLWMQAGAVAGVTLLQAVGLRRGMPAAGGRTALA